MPVRQALLAEVGAPRPAHDHDVDRVAARRDAELAVAEERDRAQVALGQAVGGDQLVARGAELLDRVRAAPCAAACAEFCRRSGGRSAGRRPGPCRSRRRGCPRRRRSRSAARARRRGSVASAQSTSSPFIQIFSVSRIRRLLSGRMVRGPARRRPSDCARDEAQRARSGTARPCAARSPRRPRARLVRRAAFARRRRASTCSSGNGATAPGVEARRLARPRRRRRSARLARRRRAAIFARVGAAVARDQREHLAAVAVEDERLDDLAELAADGVRGVRRGRRSLRELLDARLAPPRAGTRRPARRLGPGARRHGQRTARAQLSSPAPD